MQSIESTVAATESGVNEPLVATVRDVIDFVSEVVLPMLEDYGDRKRFGDVRFRLREEASFNASVLALGPGQFVVYLNTGVADELFSLLARGATLDPSLIRQHLTECEEQAGLDVDAALTLSFVAAVVFFLLHEVFHALAGHVAYTAADPLAPTSPAAHDALEKPSVPMLLELEADGAAWETTLGFTAEIFATVTDSAPLPATGRAAIDRAVMLGCLGGIALLDALPGRSRESRTPYPFPGVRVLNACSASARALMRGALASRSDRAALDRDTLDVEALLVRYRESVVPAVLLVDELLAARFGAAPFLTRGAREDADDPLTALSQDITLVLGGGLPHHSPAGRTLARFAAEHERFVAELAPYRKIDLW